MGFYYGAGRFRAADAGRCPVITPLEYVSTLGQATGTVLDGDGRPRRPSPGGEPGDGFVQMLVRRVRKNPTDPTARRLLGAALLDAGSARAGIQHLGIALRLLLAGADAQASLHRSLCARLEIGLVLIPLIRVAARSGRPALLRQVLSLLP